ncbi:MAG: BMP family protein [candidate division KSB1 bacterium]|nr:BMP family protein [candidate division KSB1 bacterium]MDZ7276570.1 BMP family protein [candidate division KSB1 bacterium]MDZ7285011.1 BMP family protein [candidate division KSB1 bacterium]MDZ7298043.1 BMP family protein [candidate division KSB1 bacterium]MDZ7307431.1 BMP family protein [candidate division KSB1 bacterium]
MKRWSLLGLFCGMTAVLLPGCQSQPAPPAAFRAALLSPGPVSDAGWNASAYEGLRRIRDELQAEISQIEVKTPAQFEQGFRDYASRGFNIVFGHGFEFQDAAAAVAPDFPNTVFITSSGTTVRPNVAPLVFEIEQATYLMGVMAALLSKTGKAGCVGGMAIPSVKSGFQALAAGAQSVKPDFVVVQSFIGNWEDVGAAKEATLALIDQGADFIFQNADAAGLGVFQAAQERGGVYVFGSNKNQNEVAPQVVLASAVLDVPQAFLNVARAVKEKTFKAKIMRMGMKENVVALVINPALQHVIPPAVAARVEKVKQDILTGQITVPMGF